ncbi:hypothetical protein F892_02129 [Acinetobacter vivianii]|jgi:hypothetical protein|uniref:Uncharacterized protein n=1 Tax=Acinetobacter vivianii TaxID=1776742 RepID=N9PYU7_9GAMM|nr:DUF4123 domain-containing protein [Acinetobacter vivianii]ENX22886.1 hypothetical protein F892_02129 [Acinetobacter vivianii]GGI62157.1 hypothetical protein GCM10011446_36520 [Acinetobacter vivianii]
MIKGKLNFEDFQKFNYILYDQYLFRNLLDIYESEKVKYKILAINVFKEKQIAPIVIRIDSMSSALLHDYYENIYLLEQTEYINKFDQMALVQNLIKTDLELDDLAEQLTKLMLINKNTLFRFYDPRVLVHLYMSRDHQILNTDIDRWLRRYRSIFDTWSFDLMGHSFEINALDLSSEQSIQKSRIQLKNFDQINSNIKEFCRKNTDFQALMDFMEKQYLAFEVKNDR